MSDKDNTGDYNTGDYNTGYYNTGYYNTGDYNTGNRNTGNRNTGNRNTGYYNTGYYNTGNYNTGNRNTGDYNTGNRNTGNRNTGNRNTGDYNTGDYNTGYFNSKTPLKINVFDISTDRSDWDNCNKPDFIYFGLTSWINKSEMTQKEKDDNNNYINTGGYLKELNYKEAFKKSYNEAGDADKKKIFNIPNFDATKFLEISGIDVNANNELAKKKAALIEKANELLDQANKL